MKKTTNLFEIYKQKLGDQVLFNGVHNFTILNNSLGWTQKKYFDRWFENQIPCISFSVAKGTKSTYWVTETHFNNISREVFLKYWKDQSVIETLENERGVYVKQVNEIYHELTMDVMMKLSESELTHKLVTINDSQGYGNCNGWYAFGFEKEFVKSLLKEANSSITSERLDEIWETLTSPVSLSFDKRSALKVFVLLDNNISLDDLALKTQYFYAGFGGAIDIDQVKNKLTEEYITYTTPEQRKQIKEEIEGELQTKYLEYQNWLLTLSLDEQKLAHYTKHIIKLRDSLRDTLSMCVVVVDRAVRFYSDQIGVQSSLLDFAIFEEILNGPQYITTLISEFENRKNEGFSIFVNYEDGEIYTENNADINRNNIETMFAHQHDLVISGEIKEIKGNIGSKGLVQGRVKVVLDLQADWNKMQEGDILVTGMTRPEFVPLMKMASAIVTDEGGITCHAAIVSREMKKPCIIGTKNATKILRDGDMVEVDANKGIVRKLS